jgi:aldehyde dehydrogenase (NAD+)
VLLDIPNAGESDIAEAFTVAARAQRDWANALPGERAKVLREAARIMDQRHAEIVDWLIRESGSTRMKAELEFSAVHSIVLEASTLPTRVFGRLMPCDIPGKENRVYREPGWSCVGNLPLELAASPELARHCARPCTR